MNLVRALGRGRQAGGSSTPEGVSFIAHALNNVFTVIRLNASMALDSLASGASPAGELGEIQAAVGRGKNCSSRSGRGGKIRVRHDGKRLGGSPMPAPTLQRRSRTSMPVGGGILFIDDERELAQLGTGFSRWNFKEHGFAELPVKPYQPAELLSAVRGILVPDAGPSPVS